MMNRKIRWQITYAWLMVLALWTFAHARTTPLLSHEDPATEKEFTEVYANITNPVISTGTAQNLRVVNLAVTGTVSGVRGRALQIKKCTTTTLFTTTSATFQSSNLTCSITPTVATSSITVSVTTSLRVTPSVASPNEGAVYTIDRSGTNLCDATFGCGTIGFNIGAGTFSQQIEAPLGMTLLDTPNSASSIAYTLQVRKLTGTVAVDVGVQGNTETMVLMEWGI